MLPIVIIPSDDELNGGEAVHAALANFTSAVEFVQAWYRSQTGETFSVLPAETISSERSAADWIRLSCQTATPDERTRFAPCNEEAYAVDGGQARFAYYSAVEELFARSRTDRADERRQFVVTVFVGDRSDVWLGAADHSALAVAAPRSAGSACPAFGTDPSAGDEACRDSVYAIGHELGHAFGLDHSCDQTEFPREGCEGSIMQAKKPPDVVLLEGEKERLRANRFFEPR